MTDKKKKAYKEYFGYVGKCLIAIAVILALAIPIIIVSMPKSYAWGDIDPDRVIEGGQIGDGINATGDDNTMCTFYIWNSNLQTQIGQLVRPSIIYLTKQPTTISDTDRVGVFPDSNNASSYDLPYKMCICWTDLYNSTTNTTYTMSTGFTNVSKTINMRPTQTNNPKSGSYAKLDEYVNKAIRADGYETHCYIRYGSGQWERCDQTSKRLNTIPSDAQFAVGYTPTQQTPDNPDIPDNPDNPDNPEQTYSVKVNLIAMGGTFGDSATTKTITLSTNNTYQYVLPNYLNTSTYTPNRDGYIFLYWSLSYDGSGGAIDIAHTYNGDMNLYAIYRKINVPTLDNDNEVELWQALVGATVSGATEWLNVLDVTIFGLNVKNAIISVITTLVVAVVVAWIVKWVMNR